MEEIWILLKIRVVICRRNWRNMRRDGNRSL